jgi:hypothetical protein
MNSLDWPEPVWRSFVGGNRCYGELPLSFGG